MVIRQKITDVEFVLSKDELGYQEVLDDFENAEFIDILTYNISAKQNVLIDKLRKSQNAEICIVTNIPERWKEYYGHTYIERARARINQYKKKLDLSNNRYRAYFNFANHAKIILTNNVVYVGSANYSEESEKNIESGILSRDKEFIYFLHETVFPFLIDESTELKTDDDIQSAELVLYEASTAFKQLAEDIRDSFYAQGGHSTTSGLLLYRGSGESFTGADIERIQRFIEQYLEILNEVNTIFKNKVFEERNIENLDEVIERVNEIQDMIEGPLESLEELANFNEEDYQNQYLDDHYAEAYDEYLEGYAQDAADEANTVHEELADGLKGDVDEMLSLLNELSDTTVSILERFNRLPFHLIKIDNT